MKQEVDIRKMLTHDVYEDKKGRAIYVDFKKNTCYLVPKSKEAMMTAYSNRGLYCTLAVLLIGWFFSWTYGVIFGLVLLLGIIIAYKLFYMPSLEVVNVKKMPEKEPVYLDFINDGKNDVVIRLVCCIGLAIVAGWYAVSVVMKGSTDLVNLISVLIAVGFFMVYDGYMFVQYIRAYQYLKENK